MRVLVTGAGGFIGRALVAQLLQSGLQGGPLTRLVALDLRLPVWTDPRVHAVQGSFTDRAVLAQALTDRPDVVFHLASLPGGASEAQPALGRQINLEGTLNLLEALHNPGAPPNVVYASSVAVYGEALTGQVDDDTAPNPSLSYGAHKWIGEIALADAIRRGALAGCALRLPGVVARPGDGAGLISAFMSQLFWRLQDRAPIELPVHKQGTAWWISVQRCAANLRLAAEGDTRCLGPRRTALMPALHLRMEEVVEAVAGELGLDVAPLVTYRPDDRVDRLFARYPPLQTRLGEALGLASDGTASALVRAVLGRQP